MHGKLVGTTRGKATALFGAPSSADRPVYVVKFHGVFTAYGAKRPTGAAAPQGHGMLLGYDAETLDVTDFAVGDAINGSADPDLSRLGAPKDIGAGDAPPAGSQER